MNSLSQLLDHSSRIIPIFEEMQWNGLMADADYFRNFSSELALEMRAIRDQISSEFFGGKPINPKSDMDVRALLARHGLKAAMKTDGGLDSTSKKSIEHINHPAIRAVFEYRSRQHIRDSFCAPVIELSNGRSGLFQIRCSIKPTRTATRRLATNKPNLLAIPSRTSLGAKVRMGYRAEEGMKLGSWDLSQIEARVLAHMSQDPVLLDLFHSSRDIHTETAARMFQVDLNVVKKEQRSVAKTINFGVFYGMSAIGLMNQLRSMGLEGWDEDKCQGALDAWFRTYVGVARFIEETGEQVRKSSDGIVRDHWGMPRFLPGIWSKDRGMRAAAQREAVSHIIQGTAQGMTQNSMVWIDEEMKRRGRTFPSTSHLGWGSVLWRLQIHDELILSMPEEMESEVEHVVLKGLTQHSGIDLSVPVLAEGRTSVYWGELK